MRNPFALILIFLLFGTFVFCQNSEAILSPGNPPLTQSMADRLCEFFEWTLDAKFDGPQRQSLNKIIIAEWKNGRKEDIDATVKLMNLSSNISQFSPDEQRLIHDKFQAALLEQIRTQPNTELNRLLANVHSNASALDRVSSSPVQKTTNSPTDASAFAGEWLNRIAGTMTTFTNNAGQYADPSGELEGYKINPNGTYEYGHMLSSTLYSCNIKLFAYATGVWSVEGNTIVFQDKTAHVSIKDKCSPTKNKEKIGTITRKIFQYRFERDEYGLKLVVSANGAESSYYKTNPGEMGW